LSYILAHSIKLRNGVKLSACNANRLQWVHKYWRNYKRHFTAFMERQQTLWAVKVCLASLSFACTTTHRITKLHHCTV